MKTLKEALAERISEDRLVRLTSDMVRIRSYSGIPAQETGVANYIKAFFDAAGIPCELKEVTDGRCNAIAVLDSGKPGRTLLFNEHMDTVEPNDMPDPFEPKIVDGQLYGRGTDDPKGMLACVMEAMLAIKETGALQQGKIVFTAVIDEEHNSIGTIDTLESGITADGAIIAEATNMEIQTCQRGLEWLEFRFIGKTVHGGFQRQGINAIAKAVDFINLVEEKLTPKINARTHPLLKESTINFAVIHGGTQPSTVAGECVLSLDRRFLPYEDYDTVLDEFRVLLDELAAKDPTFKCEMSVCRESVMKEGYVHLPMEIPPDHPLVTTLQEAFREASGEEAVMSFMPAWTDAGLLSAYGHIPTLIFGPGDGKFAHSNEEHIAVGDLTKAALIYALTAAGFCHS
ncbi:MAG: M20 family metallopeptidase [Lachnospiraceae bacterium]|nr:M20 family metallopeptidase [Lachnospiraceae bacterium]